MLTVRLLRIQRTLCRARRSDCPVRRWKPLSIATAPNGAVTQAPPSVAPQYYPIPSLPTKTNVPRTVTRVQRETVVDEAGVKSVIETPVEETEYVELGPPRTVPTPDVSAGKRLATPLVAATTLSNQLQLAPAGLSVAEANARVRVAESRRENILRQVSKGEADGDELKTLTAELDLAKVQLTQAQAEYEGRKKLLELDVRQAESDCEQAIADLLRIQELNTRVPNTISSTQIAKQEAAVEQARIELERAKTLLDIHHKPNAPQPNRRS